VKPPLSLCVRTRVVATALSLLKMLRASIQCPLSLLVIVKRLCLVVLRRWVCKGINSSPASVKAASSVQQMLFRSGVDVVVDLGCCFAWHRQSSVAIAWCRCCYRGCIAEDHRGGVAAGGHLKDFLAIRSVASKSEDSADLCMVIVDDQACWQTLAMPTGVMGRRGMPEWSRSSPVAASKGHCLGSATRLYTKNTSAVPRSSCFTTIFTPLHHPQNTMVLLKIFESNK
jgi:hypothetical protein